MRSWVVFVQLGVRVASKVSRMAGGAADMSPGSPREFAAARERAAASNNPASDTNSHAPALRAAAAAQEEDEELSKEDRTRQWAQRLWRTSLLVALIAVVFGLTYWSKLGGLQSATFVVPLDRPLTLNLVNCHVIYAADSRQYSDPLTIYAFRTRQDESNRLNHNDPFAALTQDVNGTVFTAERASDNPDPCVVWLFVNPTALGSTPLPDLTVRSRNSQRTWFTYYENGAAAGALSPASVQTLSGSGYNSFDYQSALRRATAATAETARATAQPTAAVPAMSFAANTGQLVIVGSYLSVRLPVVSVGSLTVVLEQGSIFAQSIALSTTPMYGAVFASGPLCVCCLLTAVGVLVASRMW
jgi:hypothetical protein